jgi:DNA-binding PucR family transcriptional regulator
VTFQEARAVEQVRSAWEMSGVARKVVGHEAAGLEILLLENPELARAFVRSELGPLADEAAESRRLRDTLEASFRLGSHVAAAEHLGLHEHTVRNRLARVEQLLGHPATERRTELQVAVRLLRVLSRETEPDAAEGTATDP